MKVDFKITTWEQVEIPEEHRDEILSKLEDGTITSANDLFDYIPKDGKQMDLECNKLINTDEQMSVEENDGQSTIEVQEGGEYIYHNGEL